jgi:hypothetical protein
MILKQCLGVSDSCEELCEECMIRYEAIYKKIEEEHIKDAIRLLESRGYEVRKRKE